MTKPTKTTKEHRSRKVRGTKATFRQKLKTRFKLPDEIEADIQERLQMQFKLPDDQAKALKGMPKEIREWYYRNIIALLNSDITYPMLGCDFVNLHIIEPQSVEFLKQLEILINLQYPIPELYKRLNMTISDLKLNLPTAIILSKREQLRQFTALVEEAHFSPTSLTTLPTIQLTLLLDHYNTIIRLINNSMSSPDEILELASKNDLSDLLYLALTSSDFIVNLMRSPSSFATLTDLLQINKAKLALAIKYEWVFSEEKLIPGIFATSADFFNEDIFSMEYFLEMLAKQNTYATIEEKDIKKSLDPLIQSEKEATESAVRNQQQEWPIQSLGYKKNVEEALQQLNQTPSDLANEANISLIRHHPKKATVLAAALDDVSQRLSRFSEKCSKNQIRSHSDMEQLLQASLKDGSFLQHLISDDSLSIPLGSQHILFALALSLFKKIGAQAKSSTADLKPDLQAKLKPALRAIKKTLHVFESHPSRENLCLYQGIEKNISHIIHSCIADLTPRGWSALCVLINVILAVVMTVTVLPLLVHMALYFSSKGEHPFFWKPTPPAARLPQQWKSHAQKAQSYLSELYPERVTLQIRDLADQAPVSSKASP